MIWNYIMCSVPHVRTGFEGGWGWVYAALCICELEMMSFIEAQRGWDRAIWVTATSKTSRENNSQVLRCFIELKDLKKTDKIMLHCCHVHIFPLTDTRIFFCIYKTKNDQKVRFIDNVRPRLIVQFFEQQWFYKKNKPSMNTCGVIIKHISHQKSSKLRVCFANILHQ